MCTSDIVCLFCLFFQNNAIQFKLYLQTYNKIKVYLEFLCLCGVSDKSCSVLKKMTPFYYRNFHSINTAQYRVKSQVQKIRWFSAFWSSSGLCFYFCH